MCVFFRNMQWELLLVKLPKYKNRWWKVLFFSFSFLFSFSSPFSLSFFLFSFAWVFAPKHSYYRNMLATANKFKFKQGKFRYSCHLLCDSHLFLRVGRAAMTFHTPGERSHTVPDLPTPLWCAPVSESRASV